MTEPIPTVLLIVKPASDEVIGALVDAAERIAPLVDDGKSFFELSIIEGVEGDAGSYFSGDNIHSIGRDEPILADFWPTATQDEKPILMLVEQKQRGVDCTEDDSASIKRFFDSHDPMWSPLGQFVANEFMIEHAEWDDETESLLRSDVIYQVPEHGESKRLIVATHWAWQTGNRWVAVVGDWEREGWWDGSDLPDRDAAPEEWLRPINDRPQSGTLLYINAQGQEVTESASEYCDPSEVVAIRVFLDGATWNVDGVASDGRYTESCKTAGPEDSYDVDQLVRWFQDDNGIGPEVPVVRSKGFSNVGVKRYRGEAKCQRCGAAVFEDQADEADWPVENLVIWTTADGTWGCPPDDAEGVHLHTPLRQS